MTEQEKKAIKWMQNVRDDAVVTLDHIAKEEPNVSPMLYAGRKEKAEAIIKGFEELEQYREIGNVEGIKANMEELKRWHTDKTNPKIKNVFANTSTLICHNCDHKDDYIEDLEDYIEKLEAEIEIDEYRTIGTVEECRAAVEIIRYMIQEGIEPEVLEAYVWFEDELAKKGFTVKSVLEAREKQTAAKPLGGKDIEGNEYAICRECSAILSDGEWFAQYCPDCGKKVDWGGEKEYG